MCASTLFHIRRAPNISLEKPLDLWNNNDRKAVLLWLNLSFAT